MNLFNNPKDINPGDEVYFKYDDDKIAFGHCVSLSDDLIEVDYTTELSTEKKIDKFQKGFWRKPIITN